MADLGLDDLKRRYTPALLDDMDSNPHNVGVREVRELVRLARWNLRDAERLWVCDTGHVIRIGSDTAPYDAGTCPICEALAGIPGLERERDEARRERDAGVLREVALHEQIPTEEERARLERAGRVEAAARKVDDALNAGLSSEDADGQWGATEWVAFMEAATDLAAALVPASDKGKGQ